MSSCRGIHIVMLMSSEEKKNSSLVASILIYIIYLVVLHVSIEPVSVTLRDERAFEWLRCCHSEELY